MKRKKNSINSGHYLELMDRIHVVMMNVEHHLLDHPLTEHYPDIKSKLEKAQKELWKAYQLVGKEDYENENNTY